MEIDDALVARLHRQAGADRWRLEPRRFAEALAASAANAFKGRDASARDVERYLTSLHLPDLALACACAAGNDDAWEHFVREYRPALYRAADAMAPDGGLRDVADSMYADLFGLEERNGERRTLFRYFHGRSSLATWLRAVLSQRHVDRVRSQRRLDPLPDDDSSAALPSNSPVPDPARDRFQALMQRALAAAIAALAARDRLRLRCYYAEGLTLAHTGRLLRESEATVSRQLARTRRGIRAEVERRLLEDEQLSPAQVAQCFHAVSEDAGPLDLHDLLRPGAARKESALDRSNTEKSR